MVTLAHRLGIADGNGAFDHHNRVPVVPKHRLNNTLHSGGIKGILIHVVICGYRDYNEIRIPVCLLLLCRGMQIQGPTVEEGLNIGITDGGFPLI